MNKLRHTLSCLTISAFILIAFGSLGPDESTNTNIASPGDCEERPGAGGALSINIFYHDLLGIPIGNAAGTIFITHQKIGSDCEYLLFDYFTESFATGFDGRYFTGGWEFFHDNSEDIYRVELIIKKSATHSGCRMVKAGKYNVRNFSFDCTSFSINDL
ncbi:MAG TPA: hypothetical protein VMZ69_08630 [Saprospiraceae bacterium]|nr:hypothetical protein [Saprospiraceae bacterium]